MADAKTDPTETVPGKTSPGGESGGGAYANDAPKGGEGGFMGHGGQSHEAYSGPGDETDKSRGGEEAGEDNAVSDD